MSGKRLAPAVEMRGCCSALKITIAPAAARFSRLRCSRILHGSDFEADAELTRQSERSALYERALEDLRARGLTYACECSRADIGAAAYPGTCRDKDLPEAAGLGVRMRLDSTIERFEDLRLGPQEQRPSEQCGDVLVRDRDGNWTYQFAVVVDDWLQGVNLVIRGEDLLDSTGRQIQLARLLGRAQPPAFLHHELLMKTATQKLSKSDGDTGVRDLRARGWSAEAVIDRASTSPRSLRFLPRSIQSNGRTRG